MTRDAFNLLPPQDKIDAVVKWGIPVLDYDPRAESRQALASAVQARRRKHHHHG